MVGGHPNMRNCVRCHSVRKVDNLLKMLLEQLHGSNLSLLHEFGHSEIKTGMELEPPYSLRWNRMKKHLEMS